MEVRILAIEFAGLGLNSPSLRIQPKRNRESSTCTQKTHASLSRVCSLILQLPLRLLWSRGSARSRRRDLGSSYYRVGPAGLVQDRDHVVCEINAVACIHQHRNAV